MTKSCLICSNPFTPATRRSLVCKSAECKEKLHQKRKAERLADDPTLRAKLNSYSKNYRASRQAKAADNLRRAKQRASLAETYVRYILAKQSDGLRPADFTPEAVEAERRQIRTKRRRKAAKLLKL